jgi:hypothetical protein
MDTHTQCRAMDMLTNIQSDRGGLSNPALLVKLRIAQREGKSEGQGGTPYLDRYGKYLTFSRTVDSVDSSQQRKIVFSKFFFFFLFVKRLK